MNAAQRELLRNGILVALDASGAFQPTVAALRVGLKSAGFGTATEEEIVRELGYLADKKLVEQPSKTISPEIGRWRLTADGRDHLALEGLA